MPVFAVNYVYGPDTQTRMAHRPAHRSWQSELHESGIILASGPLDDAEEAGGLLIMAAADAAEVTEHLKGDPYASLGVIEETRIRAWNPVFGPLKAE